MTDAFYWEGVMKDIKQDSDFGDLEWLARLDPDMVIEWQKLYPPKELLEIDPGEEPAWEIVTLEFRRLRADRGWKQSELAKKIGYEQNYVALVESGGAFPSMRYAKACEKAFGLKKGDLMQYPLYKRVWKNFVSKHNIPYVALIKWARDAYTLSIKAEKEGVPLEQVALESLKEQREGKKPSRRKRGRPRRPKA